MKLLKLILTALAFILYTNSSSAQQKQIWTDGNIQYKFNKNWILFSDFSSRITVEGYKQNIFTLRSSIGYKLAPKLVASAGLAWFYTDEPGSVNTNEIRIFEGIRNEFTVLKRVSLSQFLRLEQRFFNGLVDQYSLRLRLQLGALVPLNHPQLQAKTWFLNFMAEPFTNLKGTSSNLFVNRYRFTAGTGYQFTSSLRSEFSYNSQPFRTANNPELRTGEQFVRLRFFYNFN
ncbi:DUF2490 domain-containing protein [Solitalea lacus]|uniref:DUF2490 domain-containing protein n=1 Tax=Solitalea lacus TaxID=2911172 RepID=UPI001EDBF8EA|nr:DUF2490 domain-containing protein [Solitalea lacus]UKJ08932.1 DUF2490 domain-containing protein [Solitalea lacus]